MTLACGVLRSCGQHKQGQRAWKSFLRHFRGRREHQECLILLWAKQSVCLSVLRYFPFTIPFFLQRRKWAQTELFQQKSWWLKQILKKVAQFSKTHQTLAPGFWVWEIQQISLHRQRDQGMWGICSSLWSQRSQWHWLQQEQTQKPAEPTPPAGEDK